MSSQFWDSTGEGYSVEGEETLYPGNAWDRVKLGAYKLPGVCSVSVKPARRVDKQTKNGGDGSVKIFKGLDDAKVDIEITIWTPEQYEELHRITGLIWPGAGKDTKHEGKRTSAGTKTQLALDITHPECERYGIASVVILSMTSLVPGSVVGTKKMTMACEQHGKESKKNVTKKVMGSNSSANAKIDSRLPGPANQSFATPINQSFAGKP